MCQVVKKKFSQWAKKSVNLKFFHFWLLSRDLDRTFSALTDKWPFLVTRGQSPVIKAQCWQISHIYANLLCSFVHILSDEWRKLSDLSKDSARRRSGGTTGLCWCRGLSSLLMIIRVQLEIWPDLLSVYTLWIIAKWREIICECIWKLNNGQNSLEHMLYLLWAHLFLLLKTKLRVVPIICASKT